MRCPNCGAERPPQRCEFCLSQRCLPCPGVIHVPMIVFITLVAGVESDRRYRAIPRKDGSLGYLAFNLPDQQVLIKPVKEWR